MNCCVECFNDVHIRNTITNQGVVGNCDFCSSKEVAVYDVTASCNPVADMLVGVVQMYAVSRSIEAQPLNESLRDDWDIFCVGVEKITVLTEQLCHSTGFDNDDVFVQNVAIPQLVDSEFLREFCVVRGHTWSTFSDSIKYGNRFHNEMFNADAFASFLSVVAKTYSAGTEWYRARISSSRARFDAHNMGAPPKEKRSSGRINPEGIAVLYLASDDKTVLHEVRATAFDYVTIGKFKAVKDVKVVDLSGIANTSPFLYDGKLEQYAANRKVFQEISSELAKPLRRSDSSLEYLPTQYISEFIKNQGYDGVEYASTLNTSGSNIAIFNEALVECISTKLVEVKKVVFETSYL